MIPYLTSFRTRSLRRLWAVLCRQRWFPVFLAGFN
jgi:hypothetical protein